MSAVKIGGEVFIQGGNLSPTLFNVHVNELTVQLDQCAAPGCCLKEREEKMDREEKSV